MCVGWGGRGRGCNSLYFSGEDNTINRPCECQKCLLTSHRLCLIQRKERERERERGQLGQYRQTYTMHKNCYLKGSIFYSIKGGRYQKQNRFMFNSITVKLSFNTQNKAGISRKPREILQTLIQVRKWKMRLNATIKTAKQYSQRYYRVCGNLRCVF